jgi:cellulose synthase (UDP-forming)
VGRDAHLTLLILNLTGIVVGIAAMTDPPPVYLSVGWAALIILILGRMILESVTGSPVADPPPPPSDDDPPAGGEKPTPQPVTVPVSPSTVPEGIPA